MKLKQQQKLLKNELKKILNTMNSDHFCCIPVHSVSIKET